LEKLEKTLDTNNIGGIKMIGWIAWTLIGLILVVGVLLIIVVVLQTTKDSHTSAYGNNTFYGSNKGKTADSVLSKMTIYLGIIFVILCFLTTIAIIK